MLSALTTHPINAIIHDQTMRNTRSILKPFVKWAGGKGQLLEQLDAMFPTDFASRDDIVYVEPFIGGAAMLFYVLKKYPNIKRAIINDLNRELVGCYNVIKSKPDRLISFLRELQEEYRSFKEEEQRKSMYMAMRELYNSRVLDDVGTSVLFIFLNHTCFNGLYRVNSKGDFNVPFGKAARPLICDEETLRADSLALQKVDILCTDFENVVPDAGENAFFYFDPPYRPLTQTSAFTAYSKDGFNDDEQRRLAKFCRKLDKKGHRWLLSNSDPANANAEDKFFDELFDGFSISRVNASRMINSNASGRGKITELAIKNY